MTIIQAGLTAPSPCNQQLWRFIVLDDSKVKDRLISEAYSSTIIRRAASVVIVMYDGWNYKEAIQSGAMAIMNMLNCSWELQIGSCCINSFGNAKKIKDILKIPENYVIVAFVILGHSDELKNLDVPLVDRRPVQEVVSYNMYQAQGDYVKSYNPQIWKRQSLDDYQKYFCRKTFLGKQMDLVAEQELQVIKAQLENLNGDILDIFSYDGSYLKFFPKQKIYSLNLNEITGRYALSALPLEPQDKDYIKSVTWEMLGKDDFDLRLVAQVTMIMKAERISQDILGELLDVLGKKLQPGTKLTIIARKKNFFLNIFLFCLRLAFGDDVRKTGIFAFWGPFSPIDIHQVSRIFKGKGWQQIEEKQYFFLPAFFQQILQMVFQYYKSGKTSYIHRTVHQNYITRSYDWLLQRQGFKLTRHGSLAVLKFRLKNIS
ncbi:MAG: nitroreductase family protein [Candidatus Omnitrophica bacterium]|nr:nitroreductase family protein [Candidatus Omnitrophota bacterium]